MSSKVNTVRKILTLDELVRKVKVLKKQGKTIVTYNGSFDLLQVGHIRTINEAKNQGDILVLLVNSDKSIKSYKGPKRPIIPQRERVEMVAGIDGVDYVAVFDDINPSSVLACIQPDVHCNGPEWGKYCIERAVVEKGGGKIFVTKTKRVSSTSLLVSKIIDAYSTPTVKAIFLDRDGTINDNGEGYIHETEKFEFLPGVIPSLRRLSKAGYKIIVITNQSGVGRGYFTEYEFSKLTSWMLRILDHKGVIIDKVYHCPHLPEDNCQCRKPEIGLLLQAVSEFGISLNDSWMIGDEEKDVVAGRNANVQVIKLGERMSSKLKLEPNHYAKDFAEATKIILG